MVTSARSKREIEFTIKQNGDVEVDQIGYEGKVCSGDVQDVLNAIGKEKKVTRKKEYYRDQKVRIAQRR